jgi:hypothetical protein
MRHLSQNVNYYVYETGLPSNESDPLGQGRMRPSIDRRFGARSGRSVPHRHRCLRCAAAVTGSTPVSLSRRQGRLTEGFRIIHNR